MRFKILFSVTIIFFSSNIIGQINLVPNPKFEIGTANNRHSSCKYDDVVKFNTDIESWKAAIIDNQNIPHWINLSINQCSDVLVGNDDITLEYNDYYTLNNQSNVILLEQKWIERHFIVYTYYDKTKTGIVAELNSFLQPNKKYILRYKVIPLSKTNIESYSGLNHLRVHLRHKGGSANWDSYNNNQKMNDVGNYQKSLEQYEKSKWELIEHEITIDSDKDKLKHIVFVIDEGRVGIDDIELFEKCPVEIAIQNKQYFATHNYPIKEQASEILYAGRNVTGNWSQGDVIVQNNADVHFAAGQKIVIGPGFKTELGAKFIAEITPCANSSSQRINNSANNNEEREIENQLKNSFIEIYPNPTHGQFTIEIPNIAENTNLKFYNTYGQLMLQQQINSNQTQIDLSLFGKGLYLLHLKTDEGEINIKKIIVQ
jgi:hypothetical protein